MCTILPVALVHKARERNILEPGFTLTNTDTGGLRAMKNLNTIQVWRLK